MRQRKNPWIVMVLTLIYPGLGHAFMGEMGRGLLYITIHSFLLFVGLISLGFLGIPVLIFWIVAIIRSYLRAEKINKGKIPPEFQSTRSAFVSFGITVLIGAIPIYVFPFSTYFSMYDRLPSEKAEVMTYFQQSLEKKYHRRAEIRTVEFSFNAGDMNGNFEAEAIFEDFPDIPFRVSAYGEDTLQMPVHDTFVDEWIRQRHSPKYEDIIRKSLEKTAFSHSKIWVTGISTDKPILIEDLIQRPESYMEITVKTVKFMDFNETKKESLAKEIWAILLPLQQSGVKTVSFRAEVFHPNWDKTSFNSQELFKQRLAIVHISKETPIHSNEDIMNFIE